MAKGKKAKSPGKGKKAKAGGKGKAGGKARSPGKPPSATPNQQQSSTPQPSTGSSQNITAGSTASLIPGQSGASTPPLGLFKPLNRPMLPPLVLPSDRSLSLTRRPSPIIVWDWGDVWFYPVGVIAVAIVVLGMITLTLNMKAEEMAEEVDNGTSVSNETAATNEESASSIGPTPPMTFSQPTRTEKTSEHELSSSMATSEQERSATGADVESTANTLPMRTEDVTMTSIIVDRDNKRVTSGFSGMSLEGRNKSSDEELAEDSLDLP